MSTENEIGSYLTPYTNTNSNWIEDINITPETIKLLEEKITSKLFDIGVNNIIFYYFSLREAQQKQKSANGSLMAQE